MYGHLRFIRVYISFVSLRVRFCFYDSLFEAQTSNIYIYVLRDVYILSSRWNATTTDHSEDILGKSFLSHIHCRHRSLERVSGIQGHGPIQLVHIKGYVQSVCIHLLSCLYLRWSCVCLYCEDRWSYLSMYCKDRWSFLCI
jgi:hypothetical protein